MARLSIKRNRAAARRLVADFKAHYNIHQPAPDPTPEVRPLRMRQNFNEVHEPRIGTNADLFASRGDEWGALEPMRHPTLLKVTVQPDGFVHVGFRNLPEDDDFVPVVRPAREPDPAPYRARMPRLPRQDLAQAHAARQRLVIVP